VSNISEALHKATAIKAASLLEHILSSLHNVQSIQLIAEIKHIDYVEGKVGSKQEEYTTVLCYEDGKIEVSTIESCKLNHGGLDETTS
jgi:hypothetical protein